MLKQHVFDLLIDSLDSDQESRLLEHLRNDPLRDSPLFADQDLTRLCGNWTLKERLLSLEKTHRESFWSLVHLLVGQKISEACAVAAVSAVSETDVMTKMQAALLNQADCARSRSEAAGVLAAAWSLLSFDPKGELYGFGRELLDRLSPCLTSSGAIADEPAQPEAETAGESADAGTPDAADAPDDAEEADEGEEDEDAEAADESEEGEEDEEDDLGEVRTRVYPVVRGVLLHEIVGLFSGKAFKRVAAVLEKPEPEERRQLGEAFGRLRGADELEAALLRAESAAPALFERAMLAACTGALRPAMIDFRRRLAQAAGDGPALFKVWKDIGQCGLETPPNRLYEFFAGLWTLDIFTPEGRLSPRARRCVERIFKQSGVPQPLHDAIEGWSHEEAERARAAAAADEAAAETQPEAEAVRTDEADGENPADAAPLPCPYGDARLRPLLLRWLLEHLPDAEERRVIDYLKSKNLHATALTRGLRTNRLHGNEALIQRILLCDRADPRALEILLKKVKGPRMTALCRKMESAGGQRFLDCYSAGDLDRLLPNVRNSPAHGLAVLWSSGLFRDADRSAPESEMLSPVGQYLLAALEREGLVPVSEMVTEEREHREREARAEAEAQRRREAEEAERRRREEEERAEAERRAAEAAEAKARAEAEALAKIPPEAAVSYAEPRTAAKADKPARPAAEAAAPARPAAPAPADNPDRRPTPGCERWLGYARRTGNFVNFFCFAVWDGSEKRFVAATGELLRHRFPNLGAVNLYGNSVTGILDGTLYAADIDLNADLRPNLDPTGNKRADFNYRLNFDLLVRQGRMRRASDLGVYRVVCPDADGVEVDFSRTIWVRLSRDLPLEPVKGTRAAKNNKAMASLGMSSLPVLLAYQGRLLGPWSLKEDAGHHPYLAAPEGLGDGMAPGFRAPAGAACDILEASESYRAGEQWLFNNSLIADVTGLESGRFDVLGDEALLRKAAETFNARVESGPTLSVEELCDDRELFPEAAGVAESRRARLERLLAGAARGSRFASELADLVRAAMKRDLLTQGPLLDAVVDRIASDPSTVRKLGGNPAMVRALERKEEDLKQRNSERSEALRKLDEDIRKLERRRQDAARELGDIEDAEALARTRRSLEETVERLRVEERTLTESAETLEARVQNAVERAENYIYDGQAASKFMESAALWNRRSGDESYERRAEVIERLECSKLEGAELADYLAAGIATSRSYGRADALNLFLSLSQNFLTVFAGAPGSGKTTICSIMARTLGLERRCRRRRRADARGRPPLARTRFRQPLPPRFGRARLDEQARLRGLLEPAHQEL